jgi:ubiquinone/menaquinone biosynthesis C-methylase UbiE
MKNNLASPLFWGMTDLAHEVARKAMENRANVEVDEVEKGQALENVHGQALRDYKQFEQLIGGALSFLKKIGHPAGGVAVDMGSGTGVGACILSKFGAIGKVYAVEFSEYFVEKVMPLVFEKYDANTEKIQRVVSDFNRLDIGDNSLGIILDIDSFHHSEDLDRTLQECYRVLGPKGAIIAIDRAWSDRYMRAQLESKLDIEFPDYLKTKYNIPLEQHFTRRDFGEHEYTIGDWFAAFKKNGFEPSVFLLRHPPALNRFWLRLPTFEFSMILSSLLHRFGSRRLWAYGYAKERVMFVCRKVTE